MWFGADTTTSPITWKHTIGVGNNRLLVVMIAVQGTSAVQGTTTAVTFNSVSMTKVSSQQGVNAGPGWKNEVSIWYLHDPPVGVFSVSATVTVPTSPDITGVSQSYFGAAGVGTADASGQSTGTNNGALNTSITTAAQGAWVVGIINTVNDGANSGLIFSSQRILKTLSMVTNLNGRITTVDTGTFVPPSANSVSFVTQPGSGFTNYLYAIALASIKPVTITNTDLINPFNSDNYSHESADDGDYFITSGSKTMVQEYKSLHPNNTDNITFTWSGRTTLSTLISPLYVQIYNTNTSAWETLGSQTLQPADTDFTMTVTQTSNLSNYYDSSNIVTFRIYQQVV